MSNNDSWCRTDWKNFGEKASALDHIYSVLESDTYLTEHIVVPLLQNPRICADFVKSLSIRRLNSLDLDAQEKVLCLMLQHLELFAPYRLDEVLAVFIEKRFQTSSSSTIILLARELLLCWAMRQPSSIFDEVAASSLLRALKVPFGQKYSTIRVIASTDQFSSIVNSTVSSLGKRSREVDQNWNKDPRYCMNEVNTPCNLPTVTHGNLVHEEYIEDVYPRTQVTSPESMALILSSLKDTNWLDCTKDYSGFTARKSGKLEVETSEIMSGCEITKIHLSEEEGNVRKIVGCGSDIPAPASVADMNTATKDGGSLTLTESTVKGMMSHHLEGDSTAVTVVPQMKPHQSSSTHTAGPLIDTRKNQAAVALKLGVEKSSEDSLATTVDNKMSLQLLVSCRAHRATVLKLPSSSASLAPKVVQRLTQSACSLLLSIGNMESPLGKGQYAVPASQQLSSEVPNSQSSQSIPLSQPDDVAGTVVTYSLDAILLQAYALMALNLHRAPDEVLDAVSDSLLTQADSQNKQPGWQDGEHMHPSTSVLFLSGVLLLRIRALSSPASRLLLRALESAVKKAPHITIRFLLPMMLKQPSSQPQHEMLQRVARQLLSADQCDELVYCLSSRAHTQSDALPSVFLAVGQTIHALLSTSLVTSSLVGNGSTTNAKRPGAKGKTSTTSPDLTSAEQDSCYSRWNSALTGTCSLPLGGTEDLAHVWCETTGLAVQEDHLIDPELLKSINTILNMMSQLTPSTARALLDLLSAVGSAIAATKVTAAVTGTGTGSVKGSGKGTDSATFASTVSALVSVVCTMATRFSKAIVEGNLKKGLLAVLDRCGPSSLSKAALSVLQKMP